MTTEPSRSLSISAWPGTYYTSQDIYEQERERIFTRSWWCVGHADTVAEPGAFLRVEVGGESILIIRGHDGNLRALHNLCRHRGARLCRAEHGHFKSSIRCMYHGWTYRLDGKLVAAPYLHDIPPEVRDERGLHAAAVTEWLGYLWVNPSTEAPSLSQSMGQQLRDRFGISDFLARYDIANLEVAATITYNVQANWKIIFENFAECYHCPTLHPELTAALPELRSGYGTVSGPVGQNAYLAENMEGFSLSGRPAGRRLPNLHPEDERAFYGVALWPTIVLVLVPDHVVCLRIEPHGPDHTRIVGEWLFQPEDIADVDSDCLDDAVGLLDTANRQDFEACERCHLGAHSRLFEACYPHREHVIEAFHSWVEEALSNTPTHRSSK